MVCITSLNLLVFAFTYDILLPFSLKYSPHLLVDWPPYLLDILDGTTDTVVVDVKGKGASKKNPLAQSTQNAGKVSAAEYSREDLEVVERWPYWRVRLAKADLILEGGNGTRWVLEVVRFAKF